VILGDENVIRVARAGNSAERGRFLMTDQKVCFIMTQPA
jgi:hypothetical protein